jgi:hypothetical protein
VLPTVLCYIKLTRKVLNIYTIFSVRHKAALDNAKKAAQTMIDLFKVAFEYCKEWRRRNEMSSANST